MQAARRARRQNSASSRNIWVDPSFGKNKRARIIPASQKITVEGGRHNKSTMLDVFCIRCNAPSNYGKNINGQTFTNLQVDTLTSWI